MYALNLWTNPANADDIRLYVSGTTRSQVWLKKRRDGMLTWTSKTEQTPTKFRTGDHYGKINKDRAAALEVAEAFGLELGEDQWDRAVEIARSGLQVEG